MTNPQDKVLTVVIDKLLGAVAVIGAIFLAAYVLLVAGIWLNDNPKAQAAFTCGFKAFWGVRGPECRYGIKP